MKEIDVDKIIKLAAAAVILLVFAINSIATNFHLIPEANKEAAIRTAGILETIIVLLAGYYFGSSLGSKVNADRLNQVLNTTIPTGGTITQNTETTIKKEADKEIKG